ncbi:MAG TPA: hypothetical protein VMT55_00990, partial [Candidatus Sulfotelmatobacter sp.]|nr:hypothetical protein [Candidatus Sulfotelmatobacter sp.]
RLRPGQYVSAIDLLYPLLEESSNEAAEALAQTIGRDRFIQLMNDKAAALGMTQTRFSDPSGSSADNASSAEDLFNLLKYIENNRSFILSLTTGRVEETDYGQPRYRDLENFNAFSDRSDFLGGKVGKSSAAEQTMASVFLVGNARPVAVIVLGSSDSAADVSALVENANTAYEIK